MSVEQPPVMAHQNETQDQAHPVHAEIERPPDLPPAPAGRAKIMVGIALLILLVAGLVTFLAQERDRCAGEGNRCGCRPNRCRRATQARNGR